MLRQVLTGPGIALYFLDKAVSFALHRQPQVRLDETLDKTGRLVKIPQRLNIQHHSKDVLFVDYPGNLAHSLWRSQELSLFSHYKHYLVRPCLDFGCGDGSFSSALFARIDYGIDNDMEALRIARGYNIYEQLVCKDGATFPIKQESVRSIFSNSVLEHVDNIEENVTGLHEALVPGGCFIFTVPVLNFATHLSHYFGKRESDRINQRWYHRNLHPAEWWSDMLLRQGFEVKCIQPYQPDWFTLAYFALSTRPFLFLCRRGLAENMRFRRMMAQMVASSITSTTEGGNVFVIAQRR